MWFPSDPNNNINNDKVAKLTADVKAADAELAKQDAVLVGLATARGELGPVEAALERLLDMAGWMRCLKSVPAKHCGAVAVTSATAAAVVCRVVHYRGGAA